VVVALVLYWLTMFTATHVPKVPQPLPPGFSDKWQHYVAYAGLGFLLAAWWALRRPLTWRAGLGLFVVAVFYGAFDEVTQPLFHRDADLLDWRSDIIGAATGVALYAIVTTAINRRKQWPGERGASAP
jgi:VanZ family protein